VARGGRILAPGRPDRRIQLMDVRDVADFALRTTIGPVGTFNIAAPGHDTMADLLTICREVTGSGPSLQGIDPAKETQPSESGMPERWRRQITHQPSNALGGLTKRLYPAEHRPSRPCSSMRFSPATSAASVGAATSKFSCVITR
jgi:nucleoside-diphosphate-sugar epimerase